MSRKTTVFETFFESIYETQNGYFLRLNVIWIRVQTDKFEMWYLRKLSHIRDAFERRVNVLYKENFHFHEETDVVTHLNLGIESIPYKRGEMWNSVNVGSKWWPNGDVMVTPTPTLMSSTPF